MTSTQVKLFRVIRWSRFVISFLADLRCVAFRGPLQGSLSTALITFICFLKSGVLFGLRKIIYPLCKVASCNASCRPSRANNTKINYRRTVSPAGLR